jgi:predicted dehydrogenase
MDDVEAVCASEQIFFPTRPSATIGEGYDARALRGAQRINVGNEDQIQCLLRFASGAAGTLEASRVSVGKVFGISWEVSGTLGTIVMDGERFNELKIAKLNEAKVDRGFKTLLVGSQVSDYKAFFGFDYGGGGLGYYDVKVIEVIDLIRGVCGSKDCFPDFAFGAENQRIIAAIEESVRVGTWARIRRGNSL